MLYADADDMVMIMMVGLWQMGALKNMFYDDMLMLMIMVVELWRMGAH